jgi:glycosyltransferase involved in cell wall biosynthesis
MFVRNDVTVDARVLKEAATLRDAGHDVTIVGTGRPGAPHRIEREDRDGVTIVRVPLPRWRRWWRWLRAPSRLWSIARRRGAAPGDRMDALDWLAMWRFGTLGWARAAARVAGRADVYHGHDLTGLPAAVEARRRHGSGEGRPAALVYDSHELYIESGATAGRPRWAVSWLARRERSWASAANALVTVNAALADELGRKLGIGRVLVVHNCPPRPPEAIERSERVRLAATIPAEAPIVLYHGGLRPGRGLQQLAEAMLQPGLEAAHLVFLGFGPTRDEVAAGAAEPRFGGRLHLLDRVRPDEVVGWVASVDIEALPIQASNRSYELSTPNKLFEALAAGVPVVASDFAGIRSIVEGDPDGPLGELCDPTDPASIATAIRRLLALPPEARADLSRRCHRAARERWNWETESTKLVQLYRELETAR